MDHILVYGIEHECLEKQSPLGHSFGQIIYSLMLRVLVNLYNPSESEQRNFLV